MRKPFADILTTTMILVALIITIFFPPAANAKLRGGETESEGGTTTNYVFIAAGVAVIAGVTVYLVTKGKDDAQKDDQDEDIEESEDAEGSIPLEGEFAGGSESILESASAAMPAVSPFVGLSQGEAITVGLSFSF